MQQEATAPSAAAILGLAKQSGGSISFMCIHIYIYMACIAYIFICIFYIYCIYIYIYSHHM